MMRTPSGLGCIPSPGCISGRRRCRRGRTDRAARRAWRRVRDRCCRTRGRSRRRDCGARSMPASITAMPRALSRVTICVERRACAGGIEPAQRVVGAELDDHGVRAVGNRPVEPGEALRRGVAGHARIGDLDGHALGLQRLLEHGREGGPDAGSMVAGGEAVAERDDAQRSVGCPGRTEVDDDRHQEHETCGKKARKRGAPARVRARTELGRGSGSLDAADIVPICGNARREAAMMSRARVSGDACDSWAVMPASIGSETEWSRRSNFTTSI